MGERETLLEHRGFGRYLRRIREGRRLSLDSVEEMSTAYPERITKSHLSRIENGQAVPTFPRLFALSQIYGVPVSSLAERFEIEMRSRMSPPEIDGLSDDQILDRAKKLTLESRYSEALVMATAALDRSADPAAATELKLVQVDCLMHLARHESAKQECEILLGSPSLTEDQRLICLWFFVCSCFRLGKFTVAAIAFAQLENDVAASDPGPRRKAEVADVGGSLYGNMGDLERSEKLYLQAIDAWESLPSPYHACRARVSLSGVLIEAGHTGRARKLLQAASRTAESLGYDRQQALALSNLALLEYRADRLDRAEALCLRSNAIARKREWPAVIFRNCFYLWKIARSRGDAAGEKANERSMRTYLPRVEEFMNEAVEFRGYLSAQRSSGGGP